MMGLSATWAAGALAAQGPDTLSLLWFDLVVFLLAILLGFEVISKVPATLHTPLMSGSNAISGITIVGALLIAGGGFGWLSYLFGFLAVVLATINVVGGFLVTDRMLGMFGRRREAGRD